MAITFQSKLDQQSGTTVALDVGSASGRFLVVNVMRRSGSTISVTYNGVSMTQLGSLASLWNGGDTSFIFYLANPASGSNNIVITHNGTLVRWTAACYNGTLATPTNFTTAQSASSAAQSVSVNPSSSSWIVGGGWIGGAGFSTPDANTTHRTADNSSAIFDSNSEKTSSYAIGYSDSVAGDLLAFALPPASEFIISESLALVETTTNLRDRNFTVSESLTTSETITTALGKLFEIMDSLSLTEVFTSTQTFIFSVLDSLGIIEVLAQVKERWTNTTKNTSTWTSSSKNSSNWTNETKN